MSALQQQNTVLTLPSLTFDDSQSNLGIPEWRASVETQIDTYLTATDNIRETVGFRAASVDAILIALFEQFELAEEDITLFAVGGYGRCDMLPHSDVDMMFLSTKPLNETAQDKLQRFVAKLWDIKLDPGISVRTLEECLDAAQTDITIATTLVEARLLAGNPELKGVPKQIVRDSWDDKAFYHAKRDEQRVRYAENNNTEYNLEPNVKNAPGGLRDVHHIGWITKRYFRINKLSDLVHQSFMTDAEYRELKAAEDFLLLIRHHLHRITGRNENRLLFDFQRDIAKRMGYNQDEKPNAHPNAGIEALMRVYYRKAMRISTLSELLTAYYYEALIQPRLPEEKKTQTSIIDDDFEIVGYRIAVRHSKVFSKNPSNLLRLFVLMGEHGIRKIRAKTLRLLKAHNRLIDQDYRDDNMNRALFMQIIRQPDVLFHRLRTMKRYGVLGRYLPAFEKVTGLMQYDLFHRYTVDAHTLLLIRVLHRFTDEEYADSFGMVGQIYDHLERKDIIHLAAIFHDIAKGRGGDHSELGAHDAYDFCIAHGLSNADAKLVSWLVAHHLLMSMTAQKRDISDPDVIRMFAEKVGDVVHLNHLYVLTVADMNATNPELWNSWRASLMGQLFISTRRMLRAGLDSYVDDRDEVIAKTKQQAMSLIETHGSDNANDVQEIEALWEDLGDDYFLRETPSDILWHTQAILAHGDSTEPLVLVREHRELALDAVQVFVYTQDNPNLFASTVSVFNQMDLDVQDARIITATRDFALDSYVLIDRHGTLLKDDDRENMLVHAIKHSLESAESPKLVHKRLPRRLKHFDVPTKVTSQINDNAQQHQITIEALDQPGLLALIACAFLRHDIEVHMARITTLGERAEDMFMITDRHDKLLSEARVEALTKELISTLDNPESAPAVCA